MEVAAAAGVDPAAWTSSTRCSPTSRRSKARATSPLAVGGQAFQVGYLFHALVAAVAGPDGLQHASTPKSPIRPSSTRRSSRKTIEYVRAFSEQATPESREPPLERDHQHGDHRQGADADPWATG